MGTQTSKIHITETRWGTHPAFSKDWLPTAQIETWNVSEETDTTGQPKYLFCAQSKAFNYWWTRYERCVAFPNPTQRDVFVKGLKLNSK